MVPTITLMVHLTIYDLKCTMGNCLVLTCSNCKVIMPAGGQLSRQKLATLSEYPNQYRNLPLTIFGYENFHVLIFCTNNSRTLIV
jgi:hypothetical protein